MSSQTHSLDRSLVRAVEYVLHAGEWLSFWTAIVLPFVTLSLLVSGIETPGETAAFVGLLAANLVALVGGRGYRAD